MGRGLVAIWRFAPNPKNAAMYLNLSVHVIINISFDNYQKKKKKNQKQNKTKQNKNKKQKTVKIARS